VSADNSVSRLDAVERVLSRGRGRLAQLIPIRVMPRNKLTRDDRLLVAFEVPSLVWWKFSDSDLRQFLT